MARGGGKFQPDTRDARLRVPRSSSGLSVPTSGRPAAMNVQGSTSATGGVSPRAGSASFPRTLGAGGAINVNARR